MNWIRVTPCSSRYECRGFLGENVRRMIAVRQVFRDEALREVLYEKLYLFILLRHGYTYMYCKEASFKQDIRSDYSCESTSLRH